MTKRVRDLRSAPAPVPPRDLPLRHPAMMAALVVAALCLVLSASYVLYDTDLWHLLAQGRAIWSGHGIPRTDLGTWPTYGQPTFVSSWAFRAILWPLWAWGGVGALYAWRWITTLGVFALLFATARVLGARGLSAVLVLVAASLDYRLRTDIRPEMMASLLLAAQLWLLERHRAAPQEARVAKQTWWIAAIACAWANVHISYYLGFVLLAIHLLDATFARRAPGPAGEAARARSRQLWRVTLAAAAASFVNPYGGVALARPFQFALSWRHDPLFATIAELQPMPWNVALTNGQPIWPLLVLWRGWRRRWDVVEVSACVIFSGLALSSLRFVATYALVAAPFIARDLQELMTSRRWPVPRLPLAARAGLTAILSVALCLPEWLRPDLPLGIGLDRRTIPEHACDFMAAHGVQGRGFNHFHLGGYLPYRFWGVPGRLPFMSTQPELSRPEDRRLYVEALRSGEGWRALDGRYRFNWVLLDRDPVGEDSLPDVLDRDPTWAMVFSDDTAQLLVRLEGALAAVADSYAYRLVPAGRVGRYELGVGCERDPGLRARAEAELDRMIASSPQNGGASHLRGWFALMDGDRPAARRHLERAIALKPMLPAVHHMLGNLALADGRPRDALREFDLERRHHAPPLGIFFQTGVAWQRLGDPSRARAFYQRELARDPASPAADSLARLEARQ